MRTKAVRPRNGFQNVIEWPDSVIKSRVRTREDQDVGNFTLSDRVPETRNRVQNDHVVGVPRGWGSCRPVRPRQKPVEPSSLTLSRAPSLSRDPGNLAMGQLRLETPYG